MTRAVARRGAVMALFCAASVPLVLASSIATSLATGNNFVFVPAIVVVAILDRRSGKFVEAFDAETGASSEWYACWSRSYLRHYGDRAKVDWRIAAAPAWLGVALLGTFFVFLCVNAVWDFAGGGGE